MKMRIEAKPFRKRESNLFVRCAVEKYRQIHVFDDHYSKLVCTRCQASRPIPITILRELKDNRKV